MEVTDCLTLLSGPCCVKKSKLVQSVLHFGRQCTKSTTSQSSSLDPCRQNTTGKEKKHNNDINVYYYLKTNPFLI